MVQKTQTQSAAPRAKPSRPASAKAAAKSSPSSEMIAARAYEIWERNGCIEGSEQENWYQAERELAQAHDE